MRSTVPSARLRNASIPAWQTPCSVTSSHIWFAEYCSQPGSGIPSTCSVDAAGCAIARYSSQYRKLSLPQREISDSLYGTNLATGAAPQYCINDSWRYGQRVEASPPSGCAWYTAHVPYSPLEHFSSVLPASVRGISLRTDAVRQNFTCDSRRKGQVMATSVLPFCRVC